jgi:hypothetical protein
MLVFSKVHLPLTPTQQGSSTFDVILLLENPSSHNKSMIVYIYTAKIKVISQGAILIFLLLGNLSISQTSML